MELEYFPNFIRCFYPQALASETNEDLIEIGTEFQQYLDNLDLSDKIRNDLQDISPRSVITRMMTNPPGYMKGYHAALLWHFNAFIEKSRETNELIHP